MGRGNALKYYPVSKGREPPGGTGHHFAVYSEDRLGLMECLPAGPCSPSALPLTTVAPDPPPLQMHRMRAGNRKEKGCSAVVRLEGELKEQKDTTLWTIPPSVSPLFFKFPKIKREPFRHQVPD